MSRYRSCLCCALISALAGKEKSLAEKSLAGGRNSAPRGETGIRTQKGPVSDGAPV